MKLSGDFTKDNHYYLYRMWKYFRAMVERISAVVSFNTASAQRPILLDRCLSCLILLLFIFLVYRRSALYMAINPSILILAVIRGLCPIITTLIPKLLEGKCLQTIKKRPQCPRVFRGSVGQIDYGVLLFILYHALTTT